LPFFLSTGHLAITQHSGWNPTQAQVLGLRVAMVGARDAAESRPAVFYYKAEAEVQYQMNGKQFNVWLPASHPTSDRLRLERWLSDKKGNIATAFWNPKVPGEGEVKLAN
jgi:hypothetical protein